MAANSSDAYYQPLDNGFGWTDNQRLNHVLVIGTLSDADAIVLERIPADDLRTIVNTDEDLAVHEGAYLHDTPNATVLVLIVRSEIGKATEVSGRRRHGGHLGRSYELYEDYWRDASPLLSSAPVKSGDLVRSRSNREIGRVLRVVRHADSHSIDVEFGTAHKTMLTDDLEVIKGDPSRPDFWLENDPVDVQAIANTLSWIKLRYPLTDMLYSFAASRTTFKPYQFLPVLKILRSSSHRILIADEVGLGKTIEAGLIWTELEQREPIRRALIVVPSALRFKWKKEMSHRFMREIDIIDRQGLLDFAEKLEEGGDPPLIGIISIEAIRQDMELLGRLDALQPHFQLVIVDEAHALRNRVSKSHAVGSALSEWAEHLVFLSATPLNLGEGDLFNLMELLAPGEFQDAEVFRGQLEPNAALNIVGREITSNQHDARGRALIALNSLRSMEHGRPITKRPDFKRLSELLSRSGEPLTHSERATSKRVVAELNTLSGVLNRTRKLDLPDSKAKRVAEQVNVKWTPAEKAAYDLIYDAYFERARHSKLPPAFITQMPLRQASSCLPIAWKKLHNAVWADEDDSAFDAFVDRDVSDEDTDELHEVFERVRAAPRLLFAIDSKLEALRDRLRLARDQGMGQMLIFSFFKGTVEYLAQALSSEFRTAVLHGGVPQDARDGVIESFRDGRIEILIANQVASEGLDFQFCNVLVNYDLPWNPMQVEQRIGRLDRFGQENEKIFIFNMHVPETIEAEILSRLHNRIGVFERSIGDLEPILRSESARVAEVLLDPRLSSEEKRQELDRIAVAIQKREHDIEQIEKSGDILTSVHQLEVEGLTENGPTGGRYVGKHEVAGLLRGLVERHGGTLTEPDAAGITSMRGTPALARALADTTHRVKPPHPGIGRLIARLREMDPTPVTYTALADETDAIELITTRHPLTRLAIRELDTEPALLPRFGALRINGAAAAGRTILARVDIAHSEGVNSIRELWITAVDQSTLERVDEVEELLLTQLAANTLLPASTPGALLSRPASAQLERMLSHRQSAVRDERAQDNDALVAARRAAELDGLERKLQKAQQQLLEQTMKLSPSNPYLRMQAGKVQHLRESRDRIVERYETIGGFTLSVEWMATLLIET